MYSTRLVKPVNFITMTPMSDDTTVSGDELELKTLQAENESLQQEIEEVSKQLLEKQEQAPEALKELAARAQADLQNAKERMEREATDMRKFAAAGIVQKLLPAVDNFQRAFGHLPEELADNEWVKGVQAIEQDLLKQLEEAGLQKIECIGLPADTEQHEVLQAGPGEKDIIVEVYEEGYLLHEKVLRPARVKVGDGS